MRAINLERSDDRSYRSRAWPAPTSASHRGLLQAVFLQRFEQASGRLLHEIEYTLEAFCAAIIRVRHVILGPGCELEKQVNLVVVLGVGLFHERHVV